MPLTSGTVAEGNRNQGTAASCIPEYSPSMTSDLPRWFRSIYLRQHQRQRRAAEREDGARRIDVTLKGDMLDDYDTVRRYLEGLNRYTREIKDNNPRSPLFPFRLSDTEVIKMALSRAAAAIREEEERARKSGLRTMLLGD